MDFTHVVIDPLKHACRVLVLGCYADDSRGRFLAELDESLRGCISSTYAQKEFVGELNKTLLLSTCGLIPTERLLLVGLGKRDELTPDRFRQAAGSAATALRKSGMRELSSLLHLADEGSAEILKATVEGFALGSYAFGQYKTAPEPGPVIERATLLFTEADARDSDIGRLFEETTAICAAVCFARDLVSQPGNIVTPSYLAEKGREIAASCGIACQVMEREEMEQNGMHALLAVAKGSHEPPKLIILEYRGGGESDATTVLVGKGVTFDSGGISLKPREGMEKMKDDMAGAAAVMGTLMAVSALKLPLNVVGLIPAVENLPGGGAYKPGDIVRSMSGQTIEIVNTDAEGRMILCDALHFAQRYKPRVLLDIATLTGACVVALGSFATGLMGNDEGVKSALKQAGEGCGERVWELPLWDEYGELMESDIADMKNAGGAAAGSISAGWFLQRFVGKTPWAHLDIAGTAWEEKGRPYRPKGATGVGVRLLVEYLRGNAAEG